MKIPKRLVMYFLFLLGGLAIAFSGNCQTNDDDDSTGSGTGDDPGSGPGQAQDDDDDNDNDDNDDNNDNNDNDDNDDTSPMACWDFELICDTSFSGDTSGYTDDLNYYNCSAAYEGGPENVYRLVLDSPQSQVLIRLTQASYHADLFLLTDCDMAESCLANGDQTMDLLAENLTAGVYYLVVDGYEEAAGTFSGTVDCTPAGQSGRPADSGKALE